jgi:hypothetical protein
VKPYGETSSTPEVDSKGFREGFLVGILVGEGHFGGDGKQPQVTLRMHTKHEGLFQWILRNFPGGRLYGPYNHGGRHYYQWMARGEFLRKTLIPLLDRHLKPDLDAEAWSRYQAMLETYKLNATVEDGESANN